MNNRQRIATKNEGVKCRCSNKRELHRSKCETCREKKYCYDYSQFCDCRYCKDCKGCEYTYSVATCNFPGCGEEFETYADCGCDLDDEFPSGCRCSSYCDTHWKTKEADAMIRSLKVAEFEKEMSILSQSKIALERRYWKVKPRLGIDINKPFIALLPKFTVLDTFDQLPFSGELEKMRKSDVKKEIYIYDIFTSKIV